MAVRQLRGSDGRLTTPAIDKSKWPDGPWQTEPDSLEFEHAGYACQMVRNPQIGAWWAWVLLDPSHPLDGKGVRELPEELEVHGGVNVAARLSDGRWMLSFDCAHLFDLCPAMLAYEIEHDLKPLASVYETYRTFAYAKHNLKRLAEQLREKDISDIRAAMRDDALPAAAPEEEPAAAESSPQRRGEHR
jgi:hypothetical protein